MFTDNFDKLGTYPVKLMVRYKNMTYLPGNAINFNINVLDPCEGNTYIEGYDQTDPDDYYYIDSA